MLTRRSMLAATTAALAGCEFVTRANAQAVSKPVKIIVGFPAGGGTDVIARLLAEKLRGPYASTVIIENKPGGAARLSVEFVKTSDPDGTTMLYTPDFPITVYPHSFKKLSYDPLTDLAPAATSTRSMLTFNVGPLVPERVKSLKDFVEWCRENPAVANYGTTSAGGTPHFVGVMLSQASGVKMTAVHYRGGAPALQDLIGGHVASAVNPTSEAIPLAESGKLRILAVTGSQRSRFLPNIPTIREQGFEVVIDSWSGFFLPAKTSSNIVAALNAAVRDAISQPDIVESLAKSGNEPNPLTPEQFAARVRADLERWGPVVKDSGFVAED